MPLDEKSRSAIPLSQLTSNCKTYSSSAHDLSPKLSLNQGVWSKGSTNHMREVGVTRRGGRKVPRGALFEGSIVQCSQEHIKERTKQVKGTIGAERAITSS